MSGPGDLDHLQSPGGPFTLVRRADQLPAVREALERADWVALDTETTGLDPRKDRVRLLSLSTAEDTFVVDCFQVHPGELKVLTTPSNSDGSAEGGFLPINVPGG